MTADELFTQIFVRVMKGWGMISSFRQVAAAGLPHAEKVISAEHEIFVPLFLQRTCLGDKESIEHASSVADLRCAITKQTIENAQASVDAASLVFIHSVVDDAALNCCRVTALAKPEDWQDWIEQKQFVLKDLKEKGYDLLFTEAVEKRLAKLESESIMAKADMLFRLCKPSSDFRPKPSYTYDREKLLNLDKHRHEIIHGDGLGSSVPTVDEDLQYLLDTAFYFTFVVAKRYGVRLDTRLVGNGVQPVSFAGLTRQYSEVHKARERRLQSKPKSLKQKAEEVR